MERRHRVPHPGVVLVQGAEVDAHGDEELVAGDVAVAGIETAEINLKM